MVVSDSEALHEGFDTEAVIKSLRFIESYEAPIENINKSKNIQYNWAIIMGVLIV